MNTFKSLGLILVWLLITVSLLFIAAQRDVSREKVRGNIQAKQQVAEVIYYNGVPQ